MSKQGHTARVLIVEDDAMIAWDMALTLREAGIEVVGIVATGAEALAHVMALSPDIVLMDVTLREGIDGIETARALREQGAGPAIIFLTGYGDPDTANRIRALAPEGYLVKPVMADELEATIRRVLMDRAAGQSS